MSTRHTIKGRHLYRILFFGVIFAVIAVGALAFWGVREVRRDAAVVAVESSAKGVSGAVTVLVNAVTRSNDEIGGAALSSLEVPSLRKALLQIIRKHPLLTSIMISDEQGFRYILTRRPNGFVEGVPGRDGEKDSWSQLNLDGTAKSAMPPYQYDRLVVNAAFAEEFSSIKPGQVHWRSTYNFHPAGESWLTASTLVETGDRSSLISYVFPIDAIAAQLGGAERGEADKVFFYWKTGKVLPIESGAEDSAVINRPSMPQSPETIADVVIATAAGKIADQGMTTDPFPLEVNGERWWAYVMPLPVFGDTISLGVVVPWRNVVSTLTSDTFLQVFGGALVFFAAVVLYVLRRNKARIESLGLRQNAARSTEEVLHLIASGESGTLEFKQTLRFNLKSGKNGREIEHASLKTVAGFLNSDGGTLLVGVADNGKVTGFEEDKFESDDKALLHFNNLVNQHIGTEFAGYIDTAVITVQGKSVLRVYCMPAAAPAILTHAKGEEFFVRSGPASRQLTLSQFYEWLQNHSG